VQEYTAHRQPSALKVSLVGFQVSKTTGIKTTLKASFNITAPNPGLSRGIN